ncbi:hypothetical protein [Clostridium peptidivorans]|uniref:hypothetical protein n=1 Tax=Clostridium peptidivorans TaxID=100174 RepID=UPI000BE39F3F|nr:hypothetical protein [Clostridium peptidivorans]
MPAPVNIIGKKYGYWTVIKRSKNINGRSTWVCECKCGNRKIVKLHDLRNGRSKSCGCLRKETTSKNFKTHNLTNHRLFSIWSCMKTRCYNPNATNYERYGARGIRICDEWLNDFMNFYNWSMGNGYKDDLTIDRINNDGNYESSNCRWATIEQQANNKRSYKGR